MIKAPLEFLKVAVKMLCAHLMVRADNRPFEERPDTLDAVSVNVSAHPLFCAVVDAVMFGVGICDPDVTGVVVGVDFRCVGLSGFRDKTMKDFLVSALLGFLYPEPNLTAASSAPSTIVLLPT